MLEIFVCWIQPTEALFDTLYGTHPVAANLT
jgi:hypothetical protein